MTAAALLAALRVRGVEVYVADGRLRYRAPAGVLDNDLRRAAADHRAELLALLGAPSSPAWDDAAAGAELRQALAVLDAALPTAWLSTAQRNLLGIFRRQVGDYHARRDPQLFGAPAWIEAHVGHWRAEHEGTI
jgi:hypothetical protein